MTGEAFGLLVRGTPERIRTPDLLVRSQTLYPAELLALIKLPLIFRAAARQAPSLTTPQTIPQTTPQTTPQSIPQTTPQTIPPSSDTPNAEL